MWHRVSESRGCISCYCHHGDQILYYKCNFRERQFILADSSSCSLSGQRRFGSGERYQWWQKCGAAALFICHPPNTAERPQGARRVKSNSQNPTSSEPLPPARPSSLKIPQAPQMAQLAPVYSCVPETVAPTFALSEHWWSRTSPVGCLFYFRDLHFQIHRRWSLGLENGRSRNSAGERFLSGFSPGVCLVTVEDAGKHKGIHWHLVCSPVAGPPSPLDTVKKSHRFYIVLWNVCLTGYWENA